MPKLKIRRHLPRGLRTVISRGRSLLRVGARPVASARNLANPDLRRSFPGYVRTLRQLYAAAVVIWLGALVAGSVVNWAIPVVVFGVFAATAAILRIRGRSSWLLHRGVPPGSVGVGPEPKLDPDAMTAQARHHGALFKSNQFSQPVVCIADLGLATELFRTASDDLGPTPMGFERHVPGGAMRWADRDRHDYLNGLFARALAPTPVRSWRPQMVDVVTTHLDRMANDPANTDGGVAPLGPIRELVLAAWSEILLGIPSDGPAFDEVGAVVTDLGVYRRQTLSDQDTVMRLDRVSELIRDRLVPGDGGPSGGAPVEIERLHPGALEDLGTIRNLIYTVVTARDDVAGLLMWILKHLADHPEWAEAVRSASSDDVVGRVVSETLRLQQSEFLFRRARRQLKVDGATIPKGWIVRVCIHEIHRDPAKFTDPDSFDPDRFAEGGCGRDVYAPFGIDHHSCVGETLSRAFAAAFATEVTRRFDLSTIADGPIELSAYRHWAPSSRFRVRLEERSEVERVADSR